MLGLSKHNLDRFKWNPLGGKSDITGLLLAGHPTDVKAAPHSRQIGGIDEERPQNVHLKQVVAEVA